MDRDRFERHERENGIRRSLTAKAIQEAGRLERFLADRGVALERASHEEIEAYLEQRTMTTMASIDVDGLERYFRCAENTEAAAAVAQLRLRFTAPFKLSDLLDVDRALVAALESDGVRTNNQLLRVAATPKQREALADRLNLPVEVLEKVSRLADLTRMFGVRAIRAKLYYDMGIESIEQMAKWTPADLVRAAQDHVDRTGFDGIATLPKEAEFTVAMAKKLPKLAAFD